MVDSGDSHCSTQASEPPNPNPELIDPGCLDTSVVKQPGSLFDINWSTLSVRSKQLQIQGGEQGLWACGED